MRYRFLIAILWLCLTQSALQSQNALRFRHLTTANGLSSNNIRAITEDKYGFLWFGTEEGINIYDAYQFRVLRGGTLDSSGLSNDNINDLFRDYSGNIWVATSAGLNCYQYAAGRFTSWFDNVRDTSFLHHKLLIYRITENENNQLLIATEEGVIRYDSSIKKFSRIRGNTSAFDKILSVGINYIKYSDGFYWVGSAVGLGIYRCSLDAKTNMLIQQGNAFRLNTTLSSILSLNDSTIITTGDIGVFVYNYKSEIAYPAGDKTHPPPIAGGGSNTIIRTHDGKIILGLPYATNAYNGLAFYHQEDTSLVITPFKGNDPMGLTWGHCMSVYESSDHLIWIGTSRGISVYDPQKQEIEMFNQFPEDHFNQHDNIYSFCRVGSKIVLGSDGGGTWLFDTLTRQFAPLDVTNKNFVNFIYGSLALDDHRFIAGTQSQGVYLVDLKKKTTLRLATPGDTVFNLSPNAGALAFQDSSHVWIGWMGGGLSMVDLNTGEVKRYLHDPDDPNSISNNQISSLFIDDQGYLWSGLSDGINTFRSELGTGVDRIRLKDFDISHFRHDEDDPGSLSNDNVTGIVGDSKGNIWIGTKRGLNKYDPQTQKFTAWHLEDGLPFEYIATLQVDDDDNVWVASWVNGLAVLYTKTNIIRSFDLNDGLQNLRFNRGSSFKDTDGSLYFGGISGFNRIRPDRISAATMHAPVYFTNIYINGKVLIDSIPSFERSALSLKYDQTDIQIDFIALAYSDKNKVDYYYRLTGYSDIWKKTDERSANYTNLDPGTYTFEVKAVNRITGDQLDLRVMEIHIATPFWLAVWFRVLLILFAAALVYFMIRMRTNTLRRQKIALENTVQERTHELTLAKDRAEQSEKFKQQFLANMSHEIRTPMNAVSGMTELLLDKKHLPEQEKYLTAIQKSSDTLLHIINDILDISKVEAGKLELEEIDFSLGDTVNQVMQTLRIKADEKGLQFISYVDKQVPDILKGDPYRLKQILINICGNAIKFTDNGSVELKVSPAVNYTIADTDAFISVVFSVTDTGIGIPAGKLGSVFESFKQAQSSDSRKYGGTGLGLSISKQLIELQGGNISVESEEGSGTTFTFMLLYKKGSAENIEAQSALDGSIDASSLNGLRILLVDDNEYNRIVAKDTLLSKADIFIDTAVNGKEAIEKLSANAYDLILMDVQMPEMNGFEATQYIREHFDAPKKEIPVIALTASVLRTDLDRCKKAGMNAYVPKPFKVLQLLKAVADITGREIKVGKIKRDTKNYIIPQDKVTDLTFLKQFTEGDKVAMEKYIGIYLQKTSSNLVKLKSAIAENDIGTIKLTVHTMKAHCKMMGMQTALTAAVEVEMLIEKENDFLPALKHFIQLCDLSVKELSEGSGI